MHFDCFQLINQRLEKKNLCNMTKQFNQQEDFSYRSTEAFKKENKNIVEKMKERQMRARAYEQMVSTI